MTTEEKFLAAVNVIESLPKDGPFQPSEDLMLKFYSYFKQATLGPCKTSKPHFWDIINKQKWEAWKSLGTMSKEVAMEKYISELVKIVETMSYSESVSNFMDLLGPFYESVSLDEADVESSTLDDCLENRTTDTIWEDFNRSSSIMAADIYKKYPGVQKTCEYIAKEASKSLRIVSSCPEEKPTNIKQTESIMYEFTKRKKNSKIGLDNKIIANSTEDKSNKKLFVKNTRWSSKFINCMSSTQKNLVSDMHNSRDPKGRHLCITQDWLPSVAEECKIWQYLSDEKTSPAIPFNSLIKKSLIEKCHHKGASTKNITDQSVREMLTLSVKNLQHSLEEVVRHLDSIEGLIHSYKLAKDKIHILQDMFVLSVFHLSLFSSMFLKLTVCSPISSRDAHDISTILREHPLVGSVVDVQGIRDQDIEGLVMEFLPPLLDEALDNHPDILAYEQRGKSSFPVKGIMIPQLKSANQTEAKASKLPFARNLLEETSNSNVILDKKRMIDLVPQFAERLVDVLKRNDVIKGDELFSAATASSVRYATETIIQSKLIHDVFPTRELLEIGSKVEDEDAVAMQNDVSSQDYEMLPVTSTAENTPERGIVSPTTSNQVFYLIKLPDLSLPLRMALGDDVNNAVHDELRTAKDVAITVEKMKKPTNSARDIKDKDDYKYVALVAKLAKKIAKILRASKLVGANTISKLKSSYSDDVNTLAPDIGSQLSSVYLESLTACDVYNSEKKTCWFQRQVGDSLTLSVRIIGYEKNEWEGGHLEVHWEKHRYSRTTGKEKIEALSPYMGYVYLGEELTIDVENYITLPPGPLKFEWKMEKSPFEVAPLPPNMRIKNNGKTLAISELTQQQHGNVVCVIYSDDDIFLAKRRFSIRDPALPSAPLVPKVQTSLPTKAPELKSTHALPKTNVLGKTNVQLKTDVSEKINSPAKNKTKTKN